MAPSLVTILSREEVISGHVVLSLVTVQSLVVVLSRGMVRNPVAILNLVAVFGRDMVLSPVTIQNLVTVPNKRHDSESCNDAQPSEGSQQRHGFKSSSDS